MIKVGCCGYPVSRPAYYGRLATVEINSTFYALPRPATAERWKSEAPEGFEFSVKAWQLITHPSTSPTYLKLRPRFDQRYLRCCGHFRATDETAEAWTRFFETCRVLRPRFILFQTPESFYPNPDHLRDMYRFFKRIPRESSLVWEPRGSWEDEMVRRVCEDLSLVHGVDPLYASPARGGAHYFRLHGGRQGRRIVYAHAFSDDELRRALARCEGKPSYVYFNNGSMWEDALRFERLALGEAPYLPPRRQGRREW